MCGHGRCCRAGSGDRSRIGGLNDGENGYDSTQNVRLYPLLVLALHMALEKQAMNTPEELDALLERLDNPKHKMWASKKECAAAIRQLRDELQDCERLLFAVREEADGLENKVRELEADLRLADKSNGALSAQNTRMTVEIARMGRDLGEAVDHGQRRTQQLNDAIRENKAWEEREQQWLREAGLQTELAEAAIAERDALSAQYAEAETSIQRMLEVSNRHFAELLRLRAERDDWKRFKVAADAEIERQKDIVSALRAELATVKKEADRVPGLQTLLDAAYDDLQTARRRAEEDL